VAAGAVAILLPWWRGRPSVAGIHVRYVIGLITAHALTIIWGYALADRIGVPGRQIHHESFEF
jgi:hypothetical protein